MTFDTPRQPASPSVVAFRRDLHAYPETAFLEYRTASKVAAFLAGLGYEVEVGDKVLKQDVIVDPPSEQAKQIARQAALEAGGDAEWIARMAGQTGIVATHRFGDGPVLAFRFEMDALPVQETAKKSHLPNFEGFRSRWEGRMHACGHDGHVAIGLAAAARLIGATDFRGTLKLIFQPGEEGARGAAPMVAAGIVDDVDYFFAAHLGCLLPTGKIAAEATGFLTFTRWRVVFTGSEAHAAMGPQEGCNALLAGANAALNLNAIARHAGAQTFVNTGYMHAGTVFNVVPARCEMLVEIRADSTKAHDFMASRVEEILAASAQMHGCTLAAEIKGHMPGNENSIAARKIVEAAATQVAGVDGIVPGWSIGGGDDAANMIRRVQEKGGVAGYFIIGSTIAAVHHASDFDIDERSLMIGEDMFVAIAQKILGAAGS